MSSFSVDVSGGRAVTATLNDPARTAVSMPSKGGDHANVQLGSFEKIEIILPLNARVERRRTSGENPSEYVVLSVPASASMTVHCRASESGWPHGWINAGKHVQAFTESLEVIEVIHERVGDLIPPTE